MSCSSSPYENDPKWSLAPKHTGVRFPPYGIKITPRPTHSPQDSETTLRRVEEDAKELSVSNSLRHWRLATAALQLRIQNKKVRAGPEARTGLRSVYVYGSKQVDKGREC